MTLSITHTPVYCLDLDKSLAFYTEQLGFEVREDVPMGPEIRWLPVAPPADTHNMRSPSVNTPPPAPAAPPPGVRGRPFWGLWAAGLLPLVDSRRVGDLTPLAIIGCTYPL